MSQNDLNLRMSIIQQALTRYSRDPEKGELAKGIQSQFQQPTMAKVFKTITQFIEHHPQRNLKSLRALQISITKLIREEEKFKNLNGSILYKTNKVVDFFGSLFIPNWSEKRLQEIEKARQELEALKDTVQKKITEASS